MWFAPLAAAALLVLVRAAPTCHTEPCAYWLVQEEHAVLSVPASGVLLQGQVCLQGKGTVEVEGAKQAGTPGTTLHEVQQQQQQQLMQQQQQQTGSKE
jgi:hypothetical protein